MQRAVACCVPVLVAGHENVRAERLQVSENLACKNMHHRLFRLHAACGHRRLKVCSGAAHRHVMSVCSGKEVCSSGLQEKGINFKFEEKFFFVGRYNVASGWRACRDTVLSVVDGGFARYLRFSMLTRSHLIEV